MDRRIYRILDANYNRTKEALRVLEDLTRFFLNDPRMTQDLKTYRHQVTRYMLALPISYRKLVMERDSEGDVGRNHLIQDKKVAQLFDLVIANFKRSQESLRVLEEVLKVVSPKYSTQVQSLRFKLYVLEKKAIRKF